MSLIRSIFLPFIFFVSSSLCAGSSIPKVVVVGAGLAGLTTAYRLHNAGMDVELYEARNRVGGRIFTVNINGSIAELGAQNISDGGEAPHMHRLIDECDLELHSCRINVDRCYFNGNHLIPIASLLKDKKFDPQILKDQLDHLAKTSQNMKEILDKVLEENDPLYKAMAVRLAAYEGAPIEKLSPIYVNTLFHMLLEGSYSYVAPGQEALLTTMIEEKGEKYKALFAPQENLYFAGEHPPFYWKFPELWKQLVNRENESLELF